MDHFDRYNHSEQGSSQDPYHTPQRWNETSHRWNETPQRDTPRWNEKDKEDGARPLARKLSPISSIVSCL